MFEFDNADSLRQEENERKPNKYVASALQIGLLTQLICLALNEINLFHVDKNTMRICVFIGAICTLIPQIIANNERLSGDRRSKYVVLACVCGMSFVLSLALFLFAVLLCVLPMLLAAQYNSKRLSYLAITGSCLCVTVAPPLGCIMGLWDSEFLRFLISSAWGMEMWIMPAAAYNESALMNSGALGVLLFVSFPWLLTMLILGKLIMSVTRKGQEGIENRVKILKLSRLDALTGLYNQNVYTQYLKTPVSREETVGVLFFDVDGLKRTNDQMGHELGDLLLSRCAESLQDLLDDTCYGFRIGGDEFVVIVETDDPAKVDEKLAQWHKAMDRINEENEVRYQGLTCHMSVGTAFGKKYDLNDLVVRADNKMYAEKEIYHREHGIPMR